MPMGQEFFHRSFIILFSVLMGIRTYYHRRSVKYGGKAEFKEKRFLRLVFGIPLAYFVVRYAINPQYLGWGEMNIAPWLQWLGWSLGIMSVILTFWVHRHLGINFSSVLHVREKHTLITSGPYKWVRHPMYTALFISFLANWLLTKNWVIGAIPLIALVVVIVYRIKKEESLMLRTFGEEYRNYMSSTGRFLPKVK